MKKLLLVLVLFLTACSSEPEVEKEVDNKEQPPVVEDTTAPVVTVDENPTMTGETFNAEDYITVTDDSNYTVTSNYDSVVDESTSGEYVVTITVSDEHGNKTTSELIVTIFIDDTAPELEVKQKLAVYNSFDVNETVISYSDESDVEITSDYAEVVTGDGTFYITVTATDSYGNNTKKTVTIYKASNDLDHLFNYSLANGYDLGWDAQLWDEEFFNGTLQMNVYDTGKIYVYYTDKVDDYRLLFNFDYGSLDNFHLEFDQDYSTDYMEFSFSDDTRYNQATHDVTITFGNSSIHEEVAKQAAEDYANLKGDEFFAQLHSYFVNKIGVPLH